MISGLAAFSEHPLQGSGWSPRWGLSAAQLGTRTFVFGGYLWYNCIEGFFNDLYSIDTVSGLVTRVRPTDGEGPCPRFGHTLIADPSRNQLFLFGGRNGHESFNDLWVFQPSSSKWTLAAPNNFRKGRESSASESDRLKSVSESVRSESTPPVSLPSQRRQSSSSAVAQQPPVESDATIAPPTNGISQTPTNAPASALDSGTSSAGSDGSTCTSSTAKDRERCVVSNLSQQPSPRSWHSATYHRGRVYVYGGWDHNNCVYNDVWELDCALMTWRRLDAAPLSPAMPAPSALSYATTAPLEMVESTSVGLQTPVAHKKAPLKGRSCHCAAIYADNLYIFGGLQDGDTAIGEGWRFDLKERLWTPVVGNGRGPSMRTSASSIVVGDSWIIHGGLADRPNFGCTALNEVIEFHFPSATWYRRSVLLSDGAAESSRRFGHCCILGSNRAKGTSILLLGGANAYASAAKEMVCRLELLPTQEHVNVALVESAAATKTAQKAAETCDVTAREVQSLKDQEAILRETCRGLQMQVASLNEAIQALQMNLVTLQQSVSTIEQFIPMMRSFGAAIANFGTPQTAAGPLAQAFQQQQQQHQQQQHHHSQVYSVPSTAMAPNKTSFSSLSSGGGRQS